MSGRRQILDRLSDEGRARLERRNEDMAMNKAMNQDKDSKGVISRATPQPHAAFANWGALYNGNDKKNRRKNGD